MPGNILKKIFYCFCVSVIFFNAENKAQSTDSLYSVTLNVGVGYTRYIGSFPQTGLDKNSYNITGRIMWQAEHLLSVGIETGYVPLYFINVGNYQSAFGSTDVDISLIAIPVFLTFGMDIIENVKVYAGIGGAILNSTADFFDNRVVSSNWSNAYKLAAAYSFSIGDKFNLAAEIKWYNISKIEDSALLLQAALSYRLISY